MDEPAFRLGLWIPTGIEFFCLSREFVVQSPSVWLERVYDEDSPKAPNSGLLCSTHHRIVHRDHLTATVTDTGVTWHYAHTETAVA